MIHLDRRRLRAMGESAAWLLGRRRRIRVVGDSMVPTLTAGQFVLIDANRTPNPGELAVAYHPREPGLLVIKRVGSMTANGLFVLVSDNAEAGTDSRTWGPVPASDVVGTVTLLLDHPSTQL